MARTRDGLGSAVAFEGQPDDVTTQLRLLPTSPHILILPAVQSYVQDQAPDSQLSIPNFIRDVHLALLARGKAAKAFLNQSTADNKRLVFLNGGTSNAQALCVRAIMRYHTDGDILEAQKIFDHLVLGGLHGLERQWGLWRDQSCFRPETASPAMSARPSIRVEPQSEGEADDPITKAMRAADALDRETASLQPSNELDLTFASRPRCNSLPLYAYTDSFNDAAPFFVFGAQSKTSSEENMARKASTTTIFPLTSPCFSVTHYDESIQESMHHDFSDFASTSCIGETYGPPTSSLSPMTCDYFTPGTAAFTLRSPGNSMFRESLLVDGASPHGLYPPPAHRRVRSLDRMFPMTPKYGDFGIEELASSPTAVATPTFRVETFGYDSTRSEQPKASEQSNEMTPQAGDFVEAVRTATVKASRETIIFDPVPKDKKRRAVKSVYVDKGTDAEDITTCQTAFEPLFPMEEDLVIHIKDEIPDPVLDRTIQAFRDGKYPILTSAQSVLKSAEGLPAETVSIRPQNGYMPDEEKATDTMASPPMSNDEYDPFAYTQAVRPMSHPSSTIRHVSVERPPTPEKTPAASIAEVEDKFREFSILPKQTPVAIQNSLRSVLNEYFPTESQGYRQFQFSLIPELEGLWEPIFRQAEPGSPRQGNRWVDQIIALGAQREVKRDFAVSIMGQLENLGKKSSGMSRSGRLDFRYLLASALQAFTAQPLANQTTNNPFSNPYILATLLVPQLETYLALHTEVRYLILEYPPEHLGTVLAIQKLVGVDIMKVAQIIDSRSTDKLPFTHIRGASIGSQAGASDGTITARKSKQAHPVFTTEAHLSKANFLLTASASDAEIATFTSTVSRILSDVSDFYIPEPKPAPKKPSPRKARPPPLQSSFTAFPKPSIVIPTTPTSPITMATPRPASPALSTRAPSISDTLRTNTTLRTNKSSRSRRYMPSRPKSKASRRDNQAADAASMYTFDPAEDSDYDLEEKRLMPMFLQKPKRRKGDSRKALKFLGLA